MCGIAGICNFDRAIRPEDVTAVQAMLSAQVHRGPDDCGLYQDQQVVLGHRRLSIIDVSAAGHQPMANETGAVWVIYNGEIYNYPELRAELAGGGHEFRSHSDTEVLVHGYEQWGMEGLLTRLRGMFAVAIYDAAKRRLCLARDRLGIKPLYYSIRSKDGCISFASEVKALRASGGITAEIDREALAGFLLLGSVPAPLTMYGEVKCLLPGHYLQAEPGRTECRRYWDFGDNVAADAATDLATDLPGTLRDAVSRHLVSDVPLGIFLSGGVDSAGLVALARSAQPDLRTLTITFAEREYDEGAQSRKIARNFHTDHHEIRVSAKDFADELPAVLAAMDQPTHDGVNTYFVAKAARQAGLTVVLSGLGGDELFWGYPHYHWLTQPRHPLRMVSGTPRPVRRAIVSAAVRLGRLRGRENWMRLDALRNRVDPEGLYMALRGCFPIEQMQSLMGASDKETQAYLAGHLARLRPAAMNGHSTQASGVNYIEMKRYLHDQLLRDSDVFGMAHSIEIRVPYLDNEVVNHAFALPDSAKTSRAGNKPVLVDAINEALVTEASRSRKRGFSFPVAHWMRERAASMREMAMRTDVLERDAVGKLWSSFEQGRLHWSRAWSLVVLGARA